MKRSENDMKKIKQRIKDRLGEKKTAALRKAFNAGRVVKNIICWTLIAVLTVAVVIFMLTKVGGGTPSVFGYSFHRIESGSMTPELEVGDVILNKDVSDVSQLNIGDIVTFQGDARFDDHKVTHRVLVAPYDNGRGSTVIVTKGDANEVDDGEINVSSVESRFVSKVGILKGIYEFFFSPWGLIVFIFLLLLIFFDEIMNIVRLTTRRAEESEGEESIYEIIERMQREQQTEKENNETSDQADDQKKNDVAVESKKDSPVETKSKQDKAKQKKEDNAVAAKKDVKKSGAKQSAKDKKKQSAKSKNQSISRRLIPQRKRRRKNQKA
jgi:signal peptidase